MMVTISDRGQTPLDVTRRINADSDIELLQERERDAFERVVDDLKLSLSNRDGVLTKLFQPKSVNMYWDVTVSDHRKLFKGRIQSPVTFDIKGKWVNLRVFALEKVFWDLCKFQQLALVGNPNSVYMTVTDLLTRELLTGASAPLMQLGITTLDIDPIFADRKIRDTADSDNASIGNMGKYVDLDPLTKKSELLVAMARYYNAEFSIDIENDAFCMRPRTAILNDTEHNLDDVLRGDSDIELDNSDQKKYDYIRSVFQINQPEMIPHITVKRRVNLGGSPKWYTTNVYTSGEREFESSPSEPQTVFENIDLVNSPNDPDYDSEEGKKMVIRIFLNVPVGPDGTVKRRIYQTNGMPNGKPLLAYTIEDNTTTEISYEAYKRTTGGELNLSSKPPVAKYYGLSIKGWESVITYQDEQPPQGPIFDINPELNFLDSEGNVKENSVFRIFSFFGKETDLDTFASQWLDLFQDRQLLRCVARGTNYKYGDTFVSSRALPGKYTVKRALNKFIEKETALELVTV